MRIYYELSTAPDFSLSKYSTLSETGPSGVLTQHGSFWRHMNRWGREFRGVVRFLYIYDPCKAVGNKLRLVLCFDAPDKKAISSIAQIMKASSLSPYYDRMELVENCIDDVKYPWRVNSFKKERFISAQNNDTDIFYSASEWEMNENARLYSLMKMMESIDQPCAYSVNIYSIDCEERLENALAYILPHLRELNSFKVKSGTNSFSSGGRDENAKKVLDYYESVEDRINNSPHFFANVQTFATSEVIGRQLLDSANSEALQAGDCTLYSEEYNKTIIESFDEEFTCWGDPRAAEALSFLPHLYVLDELVPFVTFPVLYPGENIEMPKETAPPIQDGLFIGIEKTGHQTFFPWSNLAKHVFLAGMPGSGKTNTMMYLVAEIHKAGIPVLVLEPAKKEYRTLTTFPYMNDVSLFSPSANSMFPIHINPFEFPVGMKLADHINRLLDVFFGTFELDPPFPMLLAEGIQFSYEEIGWLPGMVNVGGLEYPTLSSLYKQIEILLEKYDYAPEQKQNLKSVLQVRIGSLIKREMGDIFDVKWSTYKPEEWLEKSAVVELASLGTGPSNFMTLMLMTLVREALDVKVYEPGVEKKPRHVIFLEEAHNLVANTTEQFGDGMDPKISATAFIVKMLAEVRALGEGIVIADQLPSAMAPEIVKNTSLKIALRLTSQDEREAMGTSMSADSHQMENMALFKPGTCLVGFEGLLRPFEMEIPEFKGDSAISDKELLAKLVSNELYQLNVYKSAEIMYRKCVLIYDKLHKDSSGFIVTIRNPIARKEKKENIDKVFLSLCDRWNVFLLETLLYINNQTIRKVVITRLKGKWDSAVRKRTIQSHEKVFELLYMKLYVKMKNEYQNLRDTYLQEIGNEELVNEKLEKLRKLQKLIFLACEE